MNNTLSQLALRELRADLRKPETWAVLLGISAVLGLMGPFGTETVLRFGPRLIYWTIIVMTTFCGGHLASGMVRAALGHMLSRPARVIASALAIGCVVSVLTLAVNAVAFGLFPSWDFLPEFLTSIFGIALVISVVFDIVEHSTAPTPRAVALLDRMAFDKRGPLVALSVEDHYVRIRTTKGEDMVLIRLSDAIKEVGDTPGFQVHRSHWVASDAVLAATRKGDRALLQMVQGPDIPVSRANLPKLKAAGFLPK